MARTVSTTIYGHTAEMTAFGFLERGAGDDDHGLHIEADGAEAYIWLSDEQLDRLFRITQARRAQMFGAAQS